MYGFEARCRAERPAGPAGKIQCVPSFRRPAGHGPLEGDANGAPHPDPVSYGKKFAGKYTHRLVKGGVGHNVPQEAPRASPTPSSMSIDSAAGCPTVRDVSVLVRGTLQNPPSPFWTPRRCKHDDESNALSCPRNTDRMRDAGRAGCPEPHSPPGIGLLGSI